MKIAVLNDDVINQIAAGEVIENPASVLKELIDNAIDAKSRRIDVEIQAGGQQLIKVDDDGCGMGQEDVKICLLRHATSKLQSIDDLQALQTMGFRGEALAAIAAISQLEIRTSDGKVATRLAAHGGRIESIDLCARNRGTTLEVRSLFFNAPARRKFQKSSSANAAQAIRVVSGLALGEPGIAFSMRSGNKIILDVKEGSWKGRIEAILGTEVTKNGIWFEKKNLYGWLGDPSQGKATRNGQYFFVNRRLIFSPLISKAVREAYGTRILETSHPSFVIFFECPLDEFDVNVHPQKKEIRFHDESRLFCRLRDAISQVFLSKDLPSFSDALSIQPTFQKIDPWDEPTLMRQDSLAKFSMDQEELLPQQPLGRPLAVIGPFLIASRGSELALVDLREAQILRTHERSAAQALMVPIQIELTRADTERVDELIQQCAKVGIEARSLGLKQLIVDALPEWLSMTDAEGFIKALKEDVDSDQAIEHFYRKVKRQFSVDEAEYLWRHGHAKEVILSAADLEQVWIKKM